MTRSRFTPGRAGRVRRARRAFLGLGAVAVLLATATACGADAGDDQQPDHRAFALHGRTLTVDSDDSSLEIVATDARPAGHVQVTRWFKGSVLVGGDPEVTWSMKDDRLTLRLHCSGVVADCAARHRVEVPRGVAVRVVDGDGSVRARGFRDALSIRTGDGSVRVTDTTGPLELRSGDGSLRAEVGSRRVSAHSGDGSVHLELSSVPDRVESVAGDGSVTLVLPRATYKVTAHSADGGVDVSVPRDDAARAHVVSARTGDGHITVRSGN
ncbi:DUF4097 family beta strand repeat-containing protein [Streptomyces longwoodensis]|uniref:DUF4097 family beta strand repeat-containing protein n=1 Tax=Streptomyces longwoodensis TaxID=68231 RepID=UPI00225A9DE0|nr:DUF4097 family beta strand repeat-containing protein [Streptomyces longwoodensis]MCX4998512.1 DUF4097 domain-containing protein [Streptomyces longwoodensis]